MTALIIVLILIVALLGVLVAGVLRSHAEILKTLHDMGMREDGTISEPPRNAPLTQPGVPAPRSTGTALGTDLTGTKPDGAPRQISILGAEHTTLLAFLSTGCTTCKGFWEEFGKRRDLKLPGNDTRMVIVTKSAAAESASKLRTLAPAHWPLVMSTEAWDHYGVPVSPYFILIDGPSGQVVGEGAGSSWSQVHSLLKQAVADAGLFNEAGRNAPGLSGAEREDRADAELRAAGVEPGDPSLYATTLPEEQE